MQERPQPQTPEAVDWWLSQWCRGDVISGSEPMTRQDVERLIGENGGTGEGLDLSFRNLNSADLSGLNLRGICLRGADLGRADLRNADLFRADLQEADLFRSDLRGTFMMQVNMDRCYLLAARIDEQTDLGDANWGHKYICEWERIELFGNARATYRQLNIWHKNHGYSDIAGEFLYREWVCKRLEAQRLVGDALSWRRPWTIFHALKMRWLKTFLAFFWLVSFELLFGYGERPFRISFAAAFVVVVFALIFFLYPPTDIAGSNGKELLPRLWHSIYFSLVSFTTLGYGGWVGHPDSWIRSLGGLESFIGLFITAMFLVTFTRKWTK